MALATCLVVAFHDSEMIGALLPRLDHPDLEVLVVNVEADPAVAATGADVIDVTTNVGYAAAVNVGARSATAPVIVFCNDDIALDAEAVLALASEVSSGRADVAVPAVLDRRGDVERTIAALPTPRSLAVEWALLPDRPLRRLDGLHVEKWRTPRSPEPIDAAAAVVVAVRADLLADTPLPEEYFLYWEESEWFWKLRERGARALFVPGIAVRHLGGRDDVRPEKSVLLARNAVRCVRRTQGRAAAALAVPIVVLWNLRLLVMAVARRSIGRRAPVTARLAGFRAALGSWREV